MVGINVQAAPTGNWSIMPTTQRSKLQMFYKAKKKNTESTENHKEHREKNKISVNSVLLCDLCVPIIFKFLTKKTKTLLVIL